MNKARKPFGTIVRRSVSLAIVIASLAASATLAVSGLARLWGSPGNITTEAIGNIVHFVAHMIAWRNEDAADIWLFQVPIALITYMLIIAAPLVIGCLALEVWEHCHEKADGVSTTP